MLLLMLQHVSSRVAGFFGAVAVSAGEAAKPILVEGFKQAVMSFKRSTSRHSNMFHDVSKVVLCGRRATFATFSEDALHFSWQARHFGHLRCHLAWQAQHFRRVVLRIFANCIVRAARRGDTHHSTLYTLHSILYTPHFTLYTLQSQFHSSHSTLHTFNFTLNTPHFPRYTPHFTLKLYTSHFTPHT